MKQLNDLIKQLEEAMEEGWTNQANGERTSDDVYFIIGELESLGVGKVYVPMINGRMGWLNLEDQSF